MRCPTLDELPDPPPGKTGWPWTEQSPQLPEAMPDGTPWPTINIVTPSYNQGPFIEQTIRSILLQGYPALQHIVIDGGSIDATVDVIEKYAPWIDHWVSEEDRGQSHAINKGLARCTGEVFNWINSDDWLTEGALHAIGENVGGHDVLIGPGYFSGEEKERLHRTSGFSFLNLLQGYEGCGFCQQGVWLRTEQVQSCGGVDERIEYAMDRDLYVRYTYDYPDVTYVEHPLARFRLHEEAKSATGAEPFLRDHIRIGRKTLESNMNRPGLEEVCQQYMEYCRRHIRFLRWKPFVDRMREERERSRIYRVAQLVYGMCVAPSGRLNRYTLGTIRRILAQ